VTHAASFDLVIFDHDGVLVDSELIAMRIIAHRLTDNGVPTTIDQAMDTYLGTSLDAVMRAIEDSGTTIVRAEFEASFHDALFGAFRRELEPVPGIRSLLEALDAAGVPYAIASSGSSERVALGVTSAGLASFFPDDVITSRDHVDRGKPFPDLFLLAAKRANVAPERCLVVEDSPHGIDAAHRAGMRAVGLSYRTPLARLQKADWMVTDASEILSLVLRSQH
jgi:HAD superfamily hydrolase (TIGR01509 family)